MTDYTNQDIIIIGGSYAGLSAALTLGRSLRRVLVIDGGKPCNRQTPHSHNFITCDGETPAYIAGKAKMQALAYPTVKFLNDFVIRIQRNNEGFEVLTRSSDTFRAKKLLFATGITDIMPSTPGFAACWGISVLHCPYCHGYEVRGKNIGIWANGDTGFDLARLLNQWTPNLTLFTDGPAAFTSGQALKLQQHGIGIEEKSITRLEHVDGKLTRLLFADGSRQALTALFARPAFKQHCILPQQSGCGLTEQGYLRVDEWQRTTVPGIYAAGDNSSPFRSVAGAVAAGNKAGAAINRELIEDAF